MNDNPNEAVIKEIVCPKWGRCKAEVNCPMVRLFRENGYKPIPPRQHPNGSCPGIIFYDWEEN